MAMKQEFNVEDYIGLLRRRWLMIVLLAGLGCCIGLAVAHFLPKRYTSQTLVLVSQPAIPGDYVKSVVGDDTNERLATMQSQILSRARLEPVIRQLGLFDKEIDRVPMEDLVGRLRGATTVSPIQAMAETRSRGLPGFTVSVNYNQPVLAQAICSKISSMFMEENTHARQAQAENTTQFIASQLEEAKTKLDAQDSRLAAFQRRYLGALPEQEQSNLNLLSGLTSQLDATTQALSRAQQDKAFAESMLAQQIADWQATQRATQEGKNPESSALQLAAWQSQLASLKARYTDNHPDVIKLENDIASLKKRIADNDRQQERQKDTGVDKIIKPATEPPQIQNLRLQVHQDQESIREMTARQDAIQQQIKVYQERVQSSPAVQQEYKALTRDYQTALDFYNDLLKKREQSTMATDLEREQQGEQFQVLDPANLPTEPSFPKKPLFGLGGLGGGLALGFGIALLLELRDTSVRTEKEVETLLRVPVLATIPMLKAPASQPSKDPSVRLILHDV